MLPPWARPTPADFLQAAAIMKERREASVQMQIDAPTKKFTVPTEEGGKAEFEYSDFMGGMDERQRRLMDPEDKRDLKAPELTPEEAETVPGRRIR